LARNEERKDFAEEDEDAEARSKADQGMVDKTSALEYNGNAPAAAPEGVVSGVMGGALGGIAGGKVTAKMAFSTPSSLIPQAPPPKQALLANLRVHDPTAVVQTGPGLPEWSWTTVALRWHGPVERGQRLRLFLIPPALNFVLAFLRVALLALLSLCLLGVPRSFRPGAPCWTYSILDHSALRKSDCATIDWSSGRLQALQQSPRLRCFLPRSLAGVLLGQA